MAKIRDFATQQLNAEERTLFAALLAPGVAQAYDETEVAGFTMVEWSSGDFPDDLARALRQARIRVTGLDP